MLTVEYKYAPVASRNPLTFDTLREAIQHARKRFNVGRVLRVYVCMKDSGTLIETVTYRKVRGGDFEYLGRDNPRSRR